jgi:hypothetical protein
MGFNTETWEMEKEQEELRPILLRWRGYLHNFQVRLDRIREQLSQVGHTHAHDLLTAFLAEKRYSEMAGGWATIGPGDLRQFADLLRETISTKWEGDAEGWRPVVVTITDRTRHVTPQWFQQPREDDSRALPIALKNLSIALRAFERFQLGCQIESDVVDAADLLLEKLTENVDGAGAWPEARSLQCALSTWKGTTGNE